MLVSEEIRIGVTEDDLKAWLLAEMKDAMAKGESIHFYRIVLAQGFDHKYSKAVLLDDFNKYLEIEMRDRIRSADYQPHRSIKDTIKDSIKAVASAAGL